MSLESDVRALSRAADSAQGTPDRSTVRAATGIEVGATLDAFLDALETGEIRAAEPVDGDWTVNEWVKQGVLLNFSLRDISAYERGDTVYNDYIRRFCDTSAVVSVRWRCVSTRKEGNQRPRRCQNRLSCWVSSGSTGGSGSRSGVSSRAGTSSDSPSAS